MSAREAPIRLLRFTMRAHTHARAFEARFADATLAARLLRTNSPAATGFSRMPHAFSCLPREADIFIQSIAAYRPGHQLLISRPVFLLFHISFRFLPLLRHFA